MELKEFTYTLFAVIGLTLAVMVLRDKYDKSEFPFNKAEKK